MKHWGLLLAIVTVAAEIHAADVFVAETISISDPREIGQLYLDFQLAYLPIIPPAAGEMFLQTVGATIPFDQSGFKTRFLKNLIGTMHPVSGAPVYTVFAMEDASSGEVVIFNEDLSELARISRVDGYDSTAWAVAEFGSSVTPYLLALYNPARMIAEYQIIPSEYYSDHVSALEAEAAALPMMMAMSSGGITKPMASMSLGTNGLVTLGITLPEGFSERYLQIFKKDNLVYSANWISADDWVPIFQSETVFWEDPASSNVSYRYFHLSAATDTDGDGRSDLYEAWNGGDSNAYTHVDSNSNGIHDWWEEKLFGGLGAGFGSNFDSDGDGLLNGEELVFVSTNEPPVLITDPGLWSSDGDALGDGEMYAAIPTDPWNSDATPPVVAVVSPANETVIVP